MTPTTDLPTVIELRQYTLHPGTRETLITLFEREFIETQEALGLRVLGIFRDLDAPDRFVWLRGFADMASRGDRLASFYDGPVWQQHRNAANATMIDSDNVLLLRPPAGGAAARAGAAGLVSITVCAVRGESPDALARSFDTTLRTAWLAAGARWVTTLVTEASANNFPRLPVRGGESVLVLISGFDDADAQQRHAQVMQDSRAWADWCETSLTAPPQTLRLAPTARSAIAPSADDYIGRPGDFDFLVGRWDVQNRRLKQRHVGCTEWDEFPGIEEARTQLGGIVSVDEIEFPTRGFKGCTVRTLDLATRRWSIYWINSGSGVMEPPVHGGFCGDRGEFVGDDSDDGRPIKVRFLWERLGADAARWTQAFSLDGQAWETNWVMDMRRTA